MQFIYDINPIAFSIFGFDVYWYGLSYLFAFLLGKIYLSKFFKIDFNINTFINFLLIGVIVGGRLGQIFLYDWSFEAFFNRGGMSFHGGLLGAGLACLFFSYTYKVNFWKLSDLVSLAAPIGIFFGRIANSINQEILGKVVSKDFLFAVQYNRIDLIRIDSSLYRHPVTIYEAIFEGLALFVILFLLRKKVTHKGFLTMIFIIGYAFFRFFCEFFKASSANIPSWQQNYIYYYGFNYGQFLSVCLFLIAFMIGKFVLSNKSRAG